jgi:DNA-nicking Smr family endonuclease
MPSSKSSGGFQPFRKLGQMLQTPLPAHPPIRFGKPSRISPSVSCGEQTAQDDCALFKQAMHGVQPISREKLFVSGHTSKPPLDDEPAGESESVLKLKKLIRDGSGFVVADTPEYVEGRAVNVSPLIVKRLHRGDFAIQGYVDLHGLSVQAAFETVEAFLKEAVLTSKSAVLIVHGRGLSSPGQPVLKTRVIEWLTRGRWRKWVTAFASARACDGGTGATYVLLRNRPLTRRHRKRPLKDLAHHPEQQHADDYGSSQRFRLEGKKKCRQSHP